jgi:aspartokinase/homoserine dehydrogenase 1
MKVLKFGGTSVGSVDSIKAVLDIVKQSYEKQEKPLVVLSAMSGVTNLLTKMAENAAEKIAFDEDLKVLENRHFDVVKSLIAIKHQNPVFTKLKLMLNELDDILQGVYALGELSPQSKDLIVSFGERFSNYMIAKIMEQYIDDAMYVDASHYMKTDSNFGTNKRRQTDVRDRFYRLQ